MQDFRDFYIISDSNSRYSPDEFLVESATHVIIQKIEMCIYTTKGEFMGDIDFGCDLEFYLWQTKVSTEYIHSIITQQFATYIPELTPTRYTMHVSIVEGSLADIMVIDITLDDFQIQAVFK